MQSVITMPVAGGKETRHKRVAIFVIKQAPVLAHPDILGDAAAAVPIVEPKFKARKWEKVLADVGGMRRVVWRPKSDLVDDLDPQTASTNLQEAHRLMVQQKIETKQRKMAGTKRTRAIAGEEIENEFISLDLVQGQIVVRPVLDRPSAAYAGAAAAGPSATAGLASAEAAALGAGAADASSFAGAEGAPMEVDDQAQRQQGEAAPGDAVDVTESPAAPGHASSSSSSNSVPALTNTEGVSASPPSKSKSSKKAAQQQQQPANPSNAASSSSSSAEVQLPFKIMGYSTSTLASPTHSASAAAVVSRAAVDGEEGGRRQSPGPADANDDAAAGIPSDHSASADAGKVQPSPAPSPSPFSPTASTTTSSLAAATSGPLRLAAVPSAYPLQPYPQASSPLAPTPAAVAPSSVGPNAAASSATATATTTHSMPALASVPASTGLANVDAATLAQIHAHLDAQLHRIQSGR